MKTQISVVVPSFNQAKTLHDTLASIVAQDHPAHEIIVIDGGSKDNSVDVIKTFESHLSYWCSEPDGGQTAGIAKGFRRCTGDVLCWLNSDDVFVPGALRVVAETFQNDPACDVVFGDMLWLDEAGNLLGVKREMGMMPEVMLWDHNYVPQPSTFWRHSRYAQVGGLREEFNCAMDFDLWMRFLKSGARFTHVAAVLSGFRKYEAQKNQRLREISDREDFRVICEYLGRTPSSVERAAKHIVWRSARLLLKALTLKYRAQRSSEVLQYCGSPIQRGPA